METLKAFSFFIPFPTSLSFLGLKNNRLDIPQLVYFTYY